MHTFRGYTEKEMGFDVSSGAGEAKKRCGGEEHVVDTSLGNLLAGIDGALSCYQKRR
jgi:hypothetical protein